MWRDGLSYFYDYLCTADGFSLSYNEPVNWESTNSSSFYYKNLPFVPGNRSLSEGSLDIDAYMMTDYGQNITQHVYDLH